MKLNFALPVLQPDGTPVKDGDKDFLMSKALSMALSNMTDGIEPLKALDWMIKLGKGETLDLDRADQDKLKKLIETQFKGMSMLLRGRLLEVFEKKDDEKKGDKESSAGLSKVG